MIALLLSALMAASFIACSQPEAAAEPAASAGQTEGSAAASSSADVGGAVTSDAGFTQKGIPIG